MDIYSSVLGFVLIVLIVSSCDAENMCSPNPNDSATIPSSCTSESPQSFVKRYAKCSLSPECGEGPYFVEEDLIRENIIEDREGIPLSLQFNVIDYRTCEPISNAKFYLWQPDYAGIYSGFMDKPPIRRERMMPRDPRRFLRGVQISDSNGTVNFETLFPGHYRGRTPHIHFRIHLNDSVAHIGQVFFDEKIISQINSIPPYNQVKSRRLKNEEDGEFSYFNGEKSIIDLKPISDATIEQGFTGIMNVVIDPFHQSRLMWA